MRVNSRGYFLKHREQRLPTPFLVAADEIHRSASEHVFCAVWRSDLYPTIDEVIAVHARLIAAFGGSLGIRDRGALGGERRWRAIAERLL